MPYLFLLLVLTACSAPRAEADISPDSQPQEATNVKPLGDEDLEAQITKDFEPYLKYFSREKLYPYATLPNGNVVMYTNEYGMGFPNTQKIGFTPQELPEYLYDIELGFLDAYNTIATNTREAVRSLENLAELIALTRRQDYVSNNPYSYYYNSLNFIYDGILSDITVSTWVAFPKEIDENEEIFYYNTVGSFMDREESEFYDDWRVLTYGLKDTADKTSNIRYIRRYLDYFYTDDNFDTAMLNWFLTRMLFIRGQFSPFPTLSHEAEIVELSEERVRNRPQLTNIYRGLSIIPARKKK